MMKPNRYEDQIYKTTPPKGGLGRMGSNLTPISRSSKRLSFTCPVCGIIFERLACQAKGKLIHCSRECANISRTTRYEIDCVVCGSKRIIHPSTHKKNKYYTTCGADACHREIWNLPKILERPSLRRAYRDAREEVISTHNKCANCDCTSAEQWVVRGLLQIGESFSIENAELWCKHCHLTETAPLGSHHRAYRPAKTPNA